MVALEGGLLRGHPLARCRRPPVAGIQLLHRNVQRSRGGLVCKAHSLCVSLNSRLESKDLEPHTYDSLLLLTLKPRVE